MDKKIVSNIKKFLNKFKYQKFSLVNIYPTDVYLYENLLKNFENILDHNIVVSDDKAFNSEKENYQRITTKVFKTKQTKFYEATSNAVLIWHNDFENLDGLQAYYPLIFVLNVEKEPFLDTFSDNLDSWKAIYQADIDTMLLVNKNLESFKSFTFESFVLAPEPRIKSPKVVSKLKEDSPDYSIFKTLPKPIIYPADRTNIKWCQEFYTYISFILKLIVPENRERLIPYILNKQTMKVWLRAFTHFTTRPDNSENYEALESIGDTVLKTAFKIYFFKRYPYADADRLNNVGQETQSDEEQAKLSDSLGLIQWVKLDKVLEDNSKIKEDLLEALAGAIELILSDLGYHGAAVDIFVHMFSLIYDSYEFKPRINSQTWLIQLIPQLKQVSVKAKKESPTSGVRNILMPRPPAIDYEVYQDIIDFANQKIKDEGIPGLVVDEKKISKQSNQGIYLRESRTKENKIKSEWYLDEYAARVLNQYGFNFKKDQVIGMAVEATRDPSKRHAADNARDYLYKKGITKEWVDKQREKKKVQDIDPRLAREALLKAKNIHKDILKLNIKAKNLKKDNIFVLYGENKEGKKYYLDKLVTENRATDNYSLLFKKFLDG